MEKTLRMALLTAGAIAAGGSDARGQVVINEVMQSNVYCIMDDINEFPDSWAEIYNGTETMVDLQGYRIGLKDDAEKAYRIPVSTQVVPGGHVLIYCDKVGDKLHADFRIDSGKGSLYLFDAEGNKIDEVTMKKMPAPDVAYGRKSDGAQKWGYQLTPTPGARNEGGTTDTVLPEVEFDTPGGVWSQTRTLSVGLAMPDGVPEGSKIIYTTDGREPTASNSRTYSTPITVNTGQVIRAKIVCEGAISRPSNAQSYLFLGRDVQIPVLSIAVNHEYLYDYRIGIFADGPGGYNNENYRYDWRRPINLEYFEAGEGVESSLNQQCETRVQGGYTRSNALKSMAVYANKRFGTKRFDYELWPKDKPGVTDNKSFVLRNGGNDFTWCYVRDALMQRVIGRNTQIDWQGYTPVLVFINGKYHAMLALRERSNEDNVYANYGGLEDIDMVENWYELKEGSEQEMLSMIDYIYADHTWEEWQQKINIESYTNLMALNYWVYNTDFPLNNIVMWRRNKGDDGRWQWLVKDCDFGLGIWNTNDNLYGDYHRYLYSNSTPSAGFDIYQQLMKLDEFRNYFVDHLVVYMGDFLNAATFNAYLDEIWEENHGEQQRSHDVWAPKNNPWWTPNLNENLQFMRTWINKRDGIMPSLMRSNWGLGGPVKVEVNTQLTDDELSGLHITYCDVPLTRGRFAGTDYMKRTITVKAAESDNVVGWDVRLGGDTSYHEGKSYSYTPSSMIPVVINARLGENGVDNVTSDPADEISCSGAQVRGQGRICAYDLTGRIVAEGEGSLTLPARGVYMIQTTGGASRKVVY